MLLKGRTKLKVWGWLLKKDQVSEDDKHGKLSYHLFTYSMIGASVVHQGTFNPADAQSICDLNVVLNEKPTSQYLHISFGIIVKECCVNRTLKN